ncbi:aldehyde dehydrogenase [Achlya hypogyna]|uniref:Aldehyde dehydrogenase n=1 Tax=Achlya hypogyna TaxID=1202772 RepID=A0A1V9ZQU8_ACHHY|nr:aldehyde dehydrogenase [Achlya hypogyna]
MLEATPLERIAADVTDLRASFDAGKTLPLEARKAVLRQIRAMMVDGEPELAEALATDLHKPPHETYLTEIGLVLAEVQTHLDYLDDWSARSYKWTSLACFPGRSYTVPEPYGVACIIGTWNYPIHVILLPLVGAISAGNCALVRLPADGSVDTTTAVLAKLFAKHLDPGVVRFAKGGLDVSKTVLAQRFDFIFCTGGPAIGKAVARAAAEHLTPVVLELGGKSPAIVDATADVVVAARRIAWGAFINAGQTCVRPDHVFVDAKIGDTFVGALRAAVVALFGESPEMSPDYGRVANTTQFFKMKALIEKEKRFLVHGGATAAAARFVAPALFNYKTDDAAFRQSALMEDEIFGPLLPIVYFSAGVEPVLEAIRARPKPLALYVFSTHAPTVDRFVTRTSSGSVVVNDCVVQMGNLNLPFGGVGGSGQGAYHGRTSFRTFSHSKAVLQKYFWLDLPQRYMPHTASAKWLTRRAIAPVPRAVVRRTVAVVVVAAVAWLSQRPKVAAFFAARDA